MDVVTIIEVRRCFGVCLIVSALSTMLWGGLAWPLYAKHRTTAEALLHPEYLAGPNHFGVLELPDLDIMHSPPRVLARVRPPVLTPTGDIVNDETQSAVALSGGTRGSYLRGGAGVVPGGAGSATQAAAYLRGGAGAVPVWTTGEYGGFLPDDANWSVTVCNLGCSLCWGTSEITNHAEVVKWLQYNFLHHRDGSRLTVCHGNDCTYWRCNPTTTKHPEKCEEGRRRW